MSKGRMIDVKSRLESAGVTIAPTNGSENLFDVEEEIVHWNLFRSASGSQVEAHFHLFDDLGRRTTKLTDILYVVVPGTDLKLHFEKRESLHWQDNLETFVKGVLSLLPE